MKKYLYSYQYITRFLKPVFWHSYLLRITPQENCFLKVMQKSVFLEPQGKMNSDKDFWGNEILYGTLMDSHSGFTYVSSGIVEQTAEYCIPDEGNVALYRVPTSLTQMNPAMEDFLQGLKLEGTVVEQALTLSHALHHFMEYVPQSTQNGTRAAEAFLQKKGVCQDYAHILLAFCRACGMAARYVCGLIEGEGSTHAWVEVYAEDHCWWGIDPTHDLKITTGYIKIAQGRDVNDCPVNRGQYRGFTQEECLVRVIVNEI